jgi:hypothetical protein
MEVVRLTVELTGEVQTDEVQVVETWIGVAEQNQQASGFRTQDSCLMGDSATC